MEYHTTTECLRLERSSPTSLFKHGHLEQVAHDHVQRPPRRKTPHLHETVSSVQLHEAEKCFLTFRENLICFSLYHYLLSVLLSPVLSVVNTEKKADCLFCTLSSDIYRLWLDSSLELSLLQAEESQLSQPFHIWEVLQSLHHIHGPSRTLSSMFVSFL